HNINAQTGIAYTLQASDNGKIITFSNPSPVFVKVPAGLGAGFNCQIIQIGTGQVTIAPQGTTINNRQTHNKLAGQFSKATVAAYAANVFVLAGETRKVNLLLDMISVQPSRAFSFRKLKDGYTGNCAKVRLVSGGNWTDIGFDADDFFDETAALAVGSNLEILFYDQSGNNNHEQILTGNSLPTLEFNYFNERVARKLTNSYVNLGNLSSFSEGEAHRLFKVSTDPPVGSEVGLFWNIGNSGESKNFPFQDGNIYDDFGSTVRKLVGNPALPMTAWRLYSVFSAANSWQAFLDAQSLYSTTTNTVGFNSNSSLESARLMYDSDFLLFDQKLTNSDRQKIWDNIEAFYNLTF
ncbi:MAG: hypothetical protein M3Q99_07310, partial [Acidobacteriota bacterium]|nr:hypothetical protein [Acidobacteriota bacterium]